MTDIKKPQGRPRQYADTAEKMSVFRARQSATGYLRREVLVTEDTLKAIKAIVEEEAVSFVDAASALLEHGLLEYQKAQRLSKSIISNSSQVPDLSPVPGFSATAGICGAALCAPIGAGLLSEAMTDASPSAENNPVARFFKRRKDAK
jgi:hypothetical protein